ncbi:ABC-type transport auxiliary lipoprotein family protein [Pseudoalteromonas sp. OANN1]|uniref:PqiC family protein n=1 Tax=Pseudoalteromonas sp. OANN1 TaxID=2954497 RepID=UPI0020969237|nr:ABC-type transport auxiliary lipoprotein family protein [Pseudoalteromonas sp. OANN1]MCO7197936.1 ABC-type transport auxiliary lipoprotein family protein [Pseudoalteromonas sp. OANN1]
MKTGLTTFLLLFCLTGCITNPSQPVSYYQLEAKSVADEKQVELNHVLLVDKVQLIELFDQQALVQYQPENKVNIANFHFWAQPPSDMLTWNLVNALNATNQTTAIKSDKFYRNTQEHQRLVVEINEFAGHFDKGAVMSGTWYLYQYKEGSYQLTQVQPFQFETKLEQDGFSALVSAHQQNFNQLTAQISLRL